MEIGEVCLFTKDVIRLSNFYKALLNVDNRSDDPVHQFILSAEFATALTIQNDGKQRGKTTGNICLAFTVSDVDTEYERVQKLGSEIITPPTVQPWGAKNMMFSDPDGNPVAFRTFSDKAE